MNQVERIAPELLRRFPLPAPQADADKNTRGRVLIAGASSTSAGATALSGLAAFRAGAGKVMLAVPESLAIAVAVGFPEAGVYGFAETDSAPDARATGQIAALLNDFDAALIGPGLADEVSAQRLAHGLLEAAAPGPAFVIDALSLTGLGGARKSLSAHRGHVVITPHAGEMARLTGIPRERIDSDPLPIAQQVANELECVVVLKGTSTAVAHPEGSPFLFEGGNAGLATSGSGDVLAGLLAGLIARGMQPLPAALWAVFLHAKAGQLLADRIGPVGFLARELPAEIPGLLRAPC